MCAGLSSVGVSLLQGFSGLDGAKGDSGPAGPKVTDIFYFKDQEKLVIGVLPEPNSSFRTVSP